MAVGVVGSSVFGRMFCLTPLVAAVCWAEFVLVLVGLVGFGLFTVVWVVEVVFLHIGLFVAAGGLWCLGLCCLVLHVWLVCFVVARCAVAMLV